MKFVILLFYLMISGLKAEFDSEANIIGGSFALNRDFPHQVSLKIDGAHACGGSIITRKHILTVAHCIISMVSHCCSNIEVITGTGFPQLAGESHDVLKIDVHPHFNEPNLLINDIAVITLMMEMIFSDVQKPIRLPANPTGAPEFGCIAGWGARSFSDHTQATQLHKLNVTIIPNQTCRRIHKRLVYNTNMCSFSNTGLVSMGDSGSGVIINDELVGIVSWSTCQMHTPDVSTRVYSYLNFIHQAMSI